MKVSLVIFDLDGTIIDDEDEWGKAFGVVLRRLGAKGVPKFPHEGGIGIEENWPLLLRKYRLETDKNPQQLAQETVEEYLKMISGVKPKKGFLKFVADLKKSGIKVALATSSTWGVVEKLFDKLGFDGIFDFITTGEEVVYKKPDPEIFRITAEKMGVDPSYCLVFEDSKAGIKAAKEAGMKVIGIYRNKKHKDSLKGAEKCFKDFSKMSPAVFASL